MTDSHKCDGCPLGVSKLMVKLRVKLGVRTGTPTGACDIGEETHLAWTSHSWRAFQLLTLSPNTVIHERHRDRTGTERSSCSGFRLVYHDWIRLPLVYYKFINFINPILILKLAQHNYITLYFCVLNYLICYMQPFKINHNFCHSTLGFLYCGHLKKGKWPGSPLKGSAQRKGLGSWAPQTSLWRIGRILIIRREMGILSLVSVHPRVN